MFLCLLHLHLLLCHDLHLLASPSGAVSGTGTKSVVSTGAEMSSSAKGELHLYCGLGG